MIFFIKDFLSIYVEAKFWKKKAFILKRTDSKNKEPWKEPIQKIKNHEVEQASVGYPLFW